MMLLCGSNFDTGALGRRRHRHRQTLNHNLLESNNPNSPVCNAFSYFGFFLTSPVNSHSLSTFACF